MPPTVAGSRSSIVRASFELHRERHELLLRPVVQVPFELAALLVLGGYQALARRSEVLDQLHVAEYEPRLGCEVPDQALLRRVHRVARRHRDRESAEQLIAVADRNEGLTVDVGQLLASERDGFPAGQLRGPPSLGAELAADPEPHPGTGGAGPLAEDARHPRQHVLGRIGLADALGELAQDLVRSRALAVHDALGDPAADERERPDREAGDDADDHVRGVDLVEQRRSSEQRDRAEPDADDQEREDERDEGLLDDDVDILTSRA